MNNSDFMDMYSTYLSHKWVSSRDAAKAAAQKKAEQAYNAEYYRKNREEILANRRKQIAEAHNPYTKKTGVTYNSPEEASKALDNSALAKAGGSGTENRPSLGGSEINNKVYENRVKTIMQQQGVSKADAQNILNNQLNAQKIRDYDIQVRNERAARTGQSQGASQAANAAYRSQQNALKRQSASNTAASEAQATNASRARQNRTLRRQSASNTAASNAQAQASANRRAYATSTQGKMNYAIAKTTSNVNKLITNAGEAKNRVINSVNAAKTSVKNFVSNTSSAVQRAKNSVQNTLKKYFG